MTDYHTKPLLGVRVDAELQDWGRAEAERRDQKFGPFIEGLLAAERERMSRPATTPLVPVAAEQEQPQQAAKVKNAAREKCPHRLPAGAYCRACDTIKEK